MEKKEKKNEHHSEYAKLVIEIAEELISTYRQALCVAGTIKAINEEGKGKDNDNRRSKKRTKTN